MLNLKKRQTNKKDNSIQKEKKVKSAEKWRKRRGWRRIFFALQTLMESNRPRVLSN